MKMPKPTQQIAVPLPRDKSSIDVLRGTIAEAQARKGVSDSFLAGGDTADTRKRKTSVLGGGMVG